MLQEEDVMKVAGRKCYNFISIFDFLLRLAEK